MAKSEFPKEVFFRFEQGDGNEPYLTFGEAIEKMTDTQERRRVAVYELREVFDVIAKTVILERSGEAASAGEKMAKRPGKRIRG